MDIKLKKLHSDAVIPTYAKNGDAGLDLVAVDIKQPERNKLIYDTGIALEIPEGYVGLVFPRSSIHKKDLRLSNNCGIIDSGFRQSIKVVFDIIAKTSYNCDNRYAVGDRIAQIIIIPYPNINLIEVDELSETERGSGGFGSTGN